MTDKQIEDKKREFKELMRDKLDQAFQLGKFIKTGEGFISLPGMTELENACNESVDKFILKLVEEVEIGAIENFIKILIENTEVIGDESIRLVYLKGITRKRLKELLEPTN